MEEKSNLILDQPLIDQIIRRMAYEIYEQNFKEKEIILAGINGEGYSLASLLAEKLSEISPIRASLVLVSIDKSMPSKSDITLDVELKKLNRKSIVLVDDVLNTGKTLAYSMKPFLDASIKRLEAAVLVDRNHTEFPVSARYKGYELSTTINEHVLVSLGDEQTVYLN